MCRLLWQLGSGSGQRVTGPTPAGLGISQRSMTVSTVGLAPAIRKLAEVGLQVRLAVSLHTPDDELRDTLVPVNRDVNDQPWRADLLARLLRKHLGGR